MLIHKLSSQSGVSVGYLERFAGTASKRYYVYGIEKPAGGIRIIEHPSRELKAIQRWLNSRLLEQLPVHSSAMAYRKGISIRHNAEKHLGTRFTLRVDFADFFHSFKRADIFQFLTRSEHVDAMGLTFEDVNFTSNILTRYDRLAMGAPSSPLITNAMMYSFDQRMDVLMRERGIIYTRYADDLFLSTSSEGVLEEAYGAVCDVVKEFRRVVKLEINTMKTAYLSKKYKRVITGIVITPNDRLSIGREKKRLIRSMAYRFTKGELNDVDAQRLVGYLSFAKGVDNSFYSSILKKYGRITLAEIQ